MKRIQAGLFFLIGVMSFDHDVQASANNNSISAMTDQQVRAQVNNIINNGLSSTNKLLRKGVTLDNLQAFNNAVIADLSNFDQYGDTTALQNIASQVIAIIQQDFATQANNEGVQIQAVADNPTVQRAAQIFVLGLKTVLAAPISAVIFGLKKGAYGAYAGLGTGLYLADKLPDAIKVKSTKGMENAPQRLLNVLIKSLAGILTVSGSVALVGLLHGALGAVHGMEVPFKSKADIESEFGIDTLKKIFRRNGSTDQTVAASENKIQLSKDQPISEGKPSDLVNFGLNQGYAQDSGSYIPQLPSDQNLPEQIDLPQDLGSILSPEHQKINKNGINQIRAAKAAKAAKAEAAARVA